MEAKTVKEWIATLHEPYRTQADLNTPPHRENHLAPSIREALLVAFDWNNTPQGGKYWRKLQKTGRKVHSGVHRVPGFVDDFA